MFKRPHTPETKQKIANAMRGRKVSGETKAKISRKLKAQWRELKKLQRAADAA